MYWGFLGGSEAKESITRDAPIYIGDSHGKEFACNAGDPGSIPGLGRFLGEGNGYLFQYSCLENSTDRGAWQATVHGDTKSWTQLRLARARAHTHMKYI